MKIISWNVNGIRAAWSHGLAEFLRRERADIYALEETKTSQPIPYIELDGYYPFWSFCRSREGYSGTLCLSRWQSLIVKLNRKLEGWATYHKCVIEVDSTQRKRALRMAYVHVRCMTGSIDYVDTDTLPDTAIDTMEILGHLGSNTAPQGLDIPDVLMNHRIPTEAKYELENYFAYIIKKYGL